MGERSVNWEGKFCFVLETSWRQFLGDHEAFDCLRNPPVALHGPTGVIVPHSMEKIDHRKASHLVPTVGGREVNAVMSIFPKAR